jgi:polyhydroxyalkanoate synthesis regulator phasin
MASKKMQASKKNQKPERQSHRAVVSGVQSALRASMGVFSMGRSEAEAIVDKMIEKGDLTAQEGRKILSNLFDLPGRGVRQINEKVGTVLDESMVLTLNLLNVPSRSDLQQLSNKISALAEKVDELSRSVDA